MIIDLIDKSRRTRIQGEKYANEIREKRGCEPVDQNQWAAPFMAEEDGRKRKGGWGGREGMDEGDDGRCWWRLALKRAALSTGALVR